MTAFVLNGKHLKKRRGRKGRKRRTSSRCSLTNIRRRIAKIKRACKGKTKRRRGWGRHLSSEGRSFWARLSSLGRRKAANGRRRRRARNYSTWIPAFRNPSWVPSYAYNSPSSLKAAAVPSAGRFKQAGAALAAFFTNTAITNLALTRIPLPAIASGMVGRTLIGAVLSGVTAFGLNKTPLRSYSAAVGVGALAGALAAPVAMGIARLKNMLPAGLRGYMGDYLTPGDVARARSLGYLTVNEVANAAPLSGMGCCNMGCDDGLSGAETVADELNVAG